MISDHYESGFTLKRLTNTADHGLTVKSYSAVTAFPGTGRLRPLSGNEVFRNQQNNVETTHRFYCDVFAVLETDLIVKDSKNYEIKLIINPMDMDKFLQIDCLYREDLNA